MIYFRDERAKNRFVRDTGRTLDSTNHGIEWIAVDSASKALMARFNYADYSLYNGIYIPKTIGIEYVQRLYKAG